MESEEKASSYYDPTQYEFPMRLKVIRKEITVTNWEHFSELLTNPTEGVSLAKHARMIYGKVGKSWKPISFTSLLQIQPTSHYIMQYTRANASYVKGYLSGGDLGDQLFCLYGLGQAFDTISASMAEMQLEADRNLRRKMRRAENNG